MNPTDENQRFLDAIRAYGRDYEQIAQVFPGKTVKQIQAKFYQISKKLRKHCDPENQDVLAIVNNKSNKGKSSRQKEMQQQALSQDQQDQNDQIRTSYLSAIVRPIPFRVNPSENSDKSCQRRSEF